MSEDYQPYEGSNNSNYSNRGGQQQQQASMNVVGTFFLLIGILLFPPIALVIFGYYVWIGSNERKYKKCWGVGQWEDYQHYRQTGKWLHDEPSYQHLGERK